MTAVALIHRVTGLSEGPRASALARLLEQAAGSHAAELGAGIDALREKGQAWMLHRLGIAVRRWPHAGEPVEVTTWPSHRTAGARAWREFEVFSGEGELLAEAASVWLLVDLQSRKPVRLPRSLLELEFPPRITGVDFKPVPNPPAPPRLMKRRTVGPEDLDINRHANNTAYLAWAETELDTCAPCVLQVDFLEEALLGDEIRIETWDGCGQEALQRITGERGRYACLLWRQDHPPA